MERYEAWANNHVAQMKPEVKGDWVRYTDAQATIAALQARVQELEEWKRIVTGAGTDQESVIRLAAHEYTKTAVQCWKEANAKLESQLTQRTAELEAAKREARLQKEGGLRERKVADSYHQDLVKCEAELERVSLLSSHNERRFEMLEKKYKELRTLIAANKETKHDAI